MRRLVIIISFVVLTAGCATLRTDGPAGPAAEPRHAEQAQAAAERPGEKIDQPTIQEKPAEPSRPAAPEEIVTARREPMPAPSPRPGRPSLSLKEPPVPDSKLQSLTRLAASNDEKIVNIYVGMYRKTAETIMGTAQNPYKREKITAPDGKEYDVLFYLTREPRKGRPITNRMLTPIIFRKGQVAAIGQYKLKKLIRTGTLGRQKPLRQKPEPSS